jgi:hypothetical protein
MPGSGSGAGAGDMGGERRFAVARRQVHRRRAGKWKLDSRRVAAAESRESRRIVFMDLRTELREKVRWGRESSGRSGAATEVRQRTIDGARRAQTVSLNSPASGPAAVFFDSIPSWVIRQRFSTVVFFSAPRRHRVLPNAMRLPCTDTHRVSGPAGT